MNISHKIKHKNDIVKIKIFYNNSIYKCKYAEEVIDSFTNDDQTAANIIYDMNVSYNDSPAIYDYVIDHLLSDLCGNAEELDLSKEEVIITIESSTWCSKTSISQFIESHLREFLTDVINTDIDQVPTHKFEPVDIYNNLHALSDKVKVIINTVPKLKRNI